MTTDTRESIASLVERPVHALKLRAVSSSMSGAEPDTTEIRVRIALAAAIRAGKDLEPYTPAEITPDDRAMLTLYDRIFAPIPLPPKR